MARKTKDPENWKRGVLEVERTQLKKDQHCYTHSRWDWPLDTCSSIYFNALNQRSVSSFMQAALQVLISHTCLVTAMLDSEDTNQFHKLHNSSEDDLLEGEGEGEGESQVETNKHSTKFGTLWGHWSSLLW